MSPEQHIYVAVLLYESTSQSGDKAPLYEESFVLLHARDEQHARSKALEHARRSSTSYKNAEGALIHWSLKQIVDVSEVQGGRLDDGAELYSRHFRDLDAYRAFEPLLGGSVD